MRFEIIEHESAYDTIIDTVTGEEYIIVSNQSKKLLNLLNDYEYKKNEKRNHPLRNINQITTKINLYLQQRMFLTEIPSNFYTS